MITNDNFKNIEEYDHILTKRRESEMIKEDVINETDSTKLDSPLLKKDRSAMQLKKSTEKLDKKQSELRKSHKVLETNDVNAKAGIQLSKRKSAKLGRRMTPHDSPSKSDNMETSLDMRAISRGQQSMMT